MMAAVLAVGRNGTLGAGGRLPWHLPADLAHFKRVTMGHTIVMGRRTFESIGRALPGRRNVVLTRDPTYRAPGCEVVTDPSAVRELARALEPEDLFVIGGAEVFRLFLPDIARFHVTHVETDVPGDAAFPLDVLRGLRVVSCEERPPDGRNPYALKFCLYEREPVHVAVGGPEIAGGEP